MAMEINESVMAKIHKDRRTRKVVTAAKRVAPQGIGAEKLWS
jgi:UDP-N-acetyl-D-mannosaminuronic acid transferase (WecB/TagA/CpsF family)